MDTRSRWRWSRVRTLASCCLISVVTLLAAPGLVPGENEPAPSVPGPEVACPPCDDGDPCTRDICDSGTGQCVHPAVVCDDRSTCTVDTCDSAGGGCRFAPVADGTVCDDGLLCTQSDTCLGGVCAGAPQSCDDGNACTSDFCDGQTGECQHNAQTCEDGNRCTDDSCDPATGACRHDPRPAGAACDDNNPCSVADRCVVSGPGVVCQGTGTPGVACEDGNRCTTGDICTGGMTGGSAFCQGTAVSCNDNNACTSDFCDGATGECRHNPQICNDGNVCTQDTCDPALGCRFTQEPAGTVCDDSNVCTVNDICQQVAGQGFRCAGTGTVGAACDDPLRCLVGAQCVSDGRGGAVCQFQQGNACEDGNLCTNDVCESGGQCRSFPRSCNDGNSCTTESCVAGVGCQYTPQENGTACADGNNCTQGEVCQNGFCSGGTPVNCDDADPCTADSCDFQTGQCRHVPAVCNDGNPCTDDACDGATGACRFTAKPDGAACDDQSACTQGETCQAGQCAGTGTNCADTDLCTTDVCDPVSGQCLNLPKFCADTNSCTTDFCDGATGQCVHAPLPNGTTCNDNNLCTQGEACNNGFCQGTQVICNDNNTCTSDFCSPGVGGCVYQPRSNGSPCNDANACTQSDVCTNALCAGSPITCNDANPCTTDSCNPATGCVFAPRPLDEVGPLTFISQTGFDWPATPLATHWNSYRGTIPATMLGSRLPASVYNHACFESADAAGNGAMMSEDAGSPPPGIAYYYDLTEEGICGEGPPGSDSAGQVRPNPAPCPTPP